MKIELSFNNKSVTRCTGYNSVKIISANGNTFSLKEVNGDLVITNS